MQIEKIDIPNDLFRHEDTKKNCVLYTAIAKPSEFDGIGNELKNWLGRITTIDQESLTHALRLESSRGIIEKIQDTVQMVKANSNIYSNVFVYIAYEKSNRNSLQAIAIAQFGGNCVSILYIAAHPLCLDPSTRITKGAGTAVTTHIGYDALQKKVEHISLSSFYTSLGFYKKLGFDSVGDENSLTYSMRLSSGGIKQLLDRQSKTHIIVTEIKLVNSSCDDEEALIHKLSSLEIN